MPWANIWLTGIPKDAEINVDFEYQITPISSIISLSPKPPIIFDSNFGQVLPIQIINIPPGYTGTLNIELLVTESTSFQLNSVVTP